MRQLLSTTILITCGVCAIILMVPHACAQEKLSMDPPAWLMDKIDSFKNKKAPIILEDNQIIEHAPLSSAVGSYLAARHAQNKDDWVTAMAYYRTSRRLGLPTSPQHDLQYMLLSIGAGEYENGFAIAKSILDSQIKMTPHEEQLVRLIHATGLLKQGDVKGAFDDIERTPQSPLSNLINPILADWLRVYQETAPKGSKTNSNLLRLLHLAMAYEVACDQDHARKTYQKIATLKPNERAVYIIASYHLRNGDTDQALQSLQSITNGPNPDITASQWIEKIQTKQPINTQAFANHLTITYGGYAAALQDFSRLIYSEGGYDSALIFAQLARFIAPDLQGLPLTLGNIMDKKEQSVRAQNLFLSVPMQDPDFLQSRIRASDMMVEREEYVSAAKLLYDLVDDSHDARLLYALAEILRSDGRFAQAIEIYDRIEDHHDLSLGHLWSIYYVRGIAHDELEQWDQAERDFLKALEYSPQNPHILNYLGYSWVDRNIKLEQALKLLEQAVQLAPQDGYIADSLGWALYRLGRYHEAKPHLEFAISLMPGDPVINDHLGDLYWRLGRENEAKFQWLRAQPLYDPMRDQNELQELQLKIDHGLDALPDL